MRIEDIDQDAAMRLYLAAMVGPGWRTSWSCWASATRTERWPTPDACGRSSWRSGGGEEGVQGVRPPRQAPQSSRGRLLPVNRQVTA
jgi:hypothetical protein